MGDELPAELHPNPAEGYNAAELAKRTDKQAESKAGVPA
jgi:hypothetical protein